MDEDERAAYSGAETTGFQSPAQDHIEHVIDLARVLDLQQPGMYPVRVSGQAFAERGIRDGAILITNTAARPAHGKVAVQMFLFPTRDPVRSANLMGVMDGLNGRLRRRETMARKGRVLSP